MIEKDAKKTIENMRFETKKIENCFADSQNYQYLLEITADEFAAAIDNWEEYRVNEALRRPTFIGMIANKTQIKGVLSKRFIRVGYPNDNWEECKEYFETILEEME